MNPTQPEAEDLRNKTAQNQPETHYFVCTPQKVFKGVDL